jgi:hypothetical protein
MEQKRRRWFCDVVMRMFVICGLVSSSAREGKLKVNIRPTEKNKVSKKDFMKIFRPAMEFEIIE